MGIPYSSGSQSLRENLLPKGSQSICGNSLPEGVKESTWEFAEALIFFFLGFVFPIA